MKQNSPKFNVGDLVYYKPTFQNHYADGSRELGVVLRVVKDTTPLLTSFPEKKYFEYEYTVKWMNSGFTSKLLRFNLDKLNIPSKNT